MCTCARVSIWPQKTLTGGIINGTNVVTKRQITHEHIQALETLTKEHQVDAAHQTGLHCEYRGKPVITGYSYTTLRWVQGAQDNNIIDLFFKTQVKVLKVFMESFSISYLNFTFNKIRHKWSSNGAPKIQDHSVQITD